MWTHIIQVYLAALGCELRFQLVRLAVPPWWCWAGVDGGDGEEYGWSPQHRTGGVGSSSSSVGLCEEWSPRRVFMDGGLWHTVHALCYIWIWASVVWGIKADMQLFLVEFYNWWLLSEENYEAGREYGLSSYDCVLNWCVYALDQMFAQVFHLIAVRLDGKWFASPKNIRNFKKHPRRMRKNKCSLMLDWWIDWSPSLGGGRQMWNSVSVSGS